MNYIYTFVIGFVSFTFGKAIAKKCAPETAFVIGWTLGVITLAVVYVIF